MRTAREPVGHAVRQVYLDCGVVDVAVETSDEELLASALQRWAVMRATRTYITGSLGSRHRDESIGDAFELPPDRAYAETWIRWAREPLLELIDRGTYLDPQDVAGFLDLSLPGVDEVGAVLRLTDLAACPFP